MKADKSGGLYPGNRDPLLPGALMKLPIGSIVPQGWLRNQLLLEAEGMAGRLAEVSPWLKWESNSWADSEGKGHSGWEELPYWLKGYGDLGYVLKDEKIIREARKWIDAVLAGQTDDGWFGPRELRKSLQGKPDLWPNMVMLNVLQSYYEFSGDARIVPFMARYFDWLSHRPAADFGAGYWPKLRMGDNIETAYWLYNRSGDKKLLELAARMHANMADWVSSMPNWHNVNIAQGFREPGEYFLQAKEGKFLRAAEKRYDEVIGRYGQFPGGAFAGDENCRPGHTDPHQGFETCGMVEFMHSFELLTKVSGDPRWSDRCEEIAFNSLPAALTPDQKALHYLTGANMVQLDRGNKSPGVENDGTMLSYSPYRVYRCCQHNYAHGWPYYAEELWLATHDAGLCASLYAACEVSAKVGDGTTVNIAEKTDYPFGETVELEVTPAKAVRFPLYLRVPNWCGNPAVKINGNPVEVQASPLSYISLTRLWRPGDRVSLELPMKVSVRRWAKNKDAASIDYGPLTFALKIGERWEAYGGQGDWKEWEVFPTTDWNYGLVLDEKNPASDLEVTRKTMPAAKQIFTPEAVPLEIRAKAKKISAWKLDRTGLAGALQPSPVKSNAPTETITLIPMGAARLRIASFPTVGDGPDAHEWIDSAAYSNKQP
ncbi:MAG: glycoside hydrolase family 127 protein [Pirellulales bacterium]|nr:glycoside hydrolase family 127 protein [Pirellulales bacterium]